MISKLFCYLGWILFVMGFIAYGLYMTGTPIPDANGDYFQLPITIKHQAYNMILYGAAFLFAHRIIDLLEQLVENRHYHSNNPEDNNEETANYAAYVSQYQSDKAEDNTR